MRILHVSPFPPERDGIGDYCSMLCRELVRGAHRVAVISARPSPAPAPEMIGSLPRRADTSQQLLAAVDAFRPEVVHVEFALASYGTALPALLHLLDRFRADGLPVVITMHEVTRDIASLRVLGRALYRSVARRADRVIVHTGRARDELRAVGGALPDVRVIAHPSTELSAPSVSAGDLRRRFALPEDRIVLAFGFIDVDKGLDDLIAAAARLHSAGRLQDATVVIAGTVRPRFGPLRLFELRARRYLRGLERAIHRHGLTRRVRFAGYVDDGEVRSWLEAAEVLVLPYRRCEQSGVAHLARAAGAPLLVSDVGELPALTPIPAFPAGDRPALAASLDRLLSDRSLLARQAAGFGSDLSQRVSEMVSLYRELVPEQLPQETEELAWTH